MPISHLLLLAWLQSCFMSFELPSTLVQNQHQHVNVYRLITQHSLDEIVWFLVYLKRLYLVLCLPALRFAYRSYLCRHWHDESLDELLRDALPALAQRVAESIPFLLRLMSGLGQDSSGRKGRRRLLYWWSYIERLYTQPRWVSRWRSVTWEMQYMYPWTEVPGWQLTQVVIL
jgi:hypothetical protein